MKNATRAVKHQMRLHLLLRLPKIEIEMEYMCWSRIETWLEWRNHKKSKVAMYANQSIEDVFKLQNDHPLRQELSRIGSGEDKRNLRVKQWKKLEEMSGDNNERTSRGINATKRTNKGELHQFPLFS